MKAIPVLETQLIRRVRYLSVFVFALLCCLISAVPATAQSFNASLIGEVKDANEAIVSGAAVTVTNKATGSQQNTVTSDNGIFTFERLAPGEYELAIEATNFKRLLEPNLVLETNSTRRINLVLETGNISETVTVEAGAPVINTDTSDKGEVIVQKQVQDLPLNGRNFTDLALLVPGIYPRPDDDDRGEGVSSSGTRTDSSNVILDGVTNRSDRNSGVGVNTSVESIREFKVSSSNYSAEFGRTAGAQINVVTKSGGNRFSGSLFEYFRNDVLDAQNPITGAKTLRRNQYGGSLGGPIPFFNFGEGGPIFNSGKDRSFIFLSYEGTQERRSDSRFDTAPNAAWLNGDFRNIRGAGNDRILGNSDDTNRILDPLTGNEFATPNVIPQNRISNTSRLMLPFISTSNVAGTLDGYQAFGINRRSRNQYTGRFDYKIADNNNFYARYSREDGPSFSPFSGDIVFAAFGRNTSQRRDGIALSDTHIFSPNVVNEVRFGFYNQNFRSAGNFSGRNINTEFGIPGFVNLPSELAGFPRIEIDGFQDFGDRSLDPFVYRLKNYQIFDMVSVTAGNHNVKLGVDAVFSNYNERDVNPVRGRFRFRGAQTNSGSGTRGRRPGAAAFADFLLGLPETTRYLQLDTAAFANLSGNQFALFVQDDWRVTKWLTLNLGLRYELQNPLQEENGRLANFIPELAAVVVSGDPRFPTALIETDRNNFGPRIGFAMRPFGNDKTVIRGGGGIYHSLETFNPTREQLALNSPFNTQLAYTALRNSRAASAFLTFSDPFAAARGGVTGLTNPRGLSVNYDTPEVYQYNLTMEREIIRDLALEVGYVGSLGRHLGIRYNINQPRLAANGTLTGARPYAAFGDIVYQDQSATSNYNALQTSLRRRMRDGLTFLVSYTFSRSIDNASSTNVASDVPSQEFPQLATDLDAERGLSDFHRKHQFTGSFNYDLPIGKGRYFLNDASGITNVLLGGWQLNGIVSILSGRPFTPQYSSGDFGIRRPNLIGNPYANIPADLQFNPAAFADPGNGPGNLGRNTLTGPTFRNLDLSLLKNFSLNETTRIQFRTEAFNVLNHPNYRVPGFFLDIPATVGRFTRTANEGREIQFALKLLF